MNLRVEMPSINPSLRGGSMARWHVAEGESFAFGDDLCTVALDDFAVTRRTHRATKLSGRKRSKLKTALESRSGEALVEVTITASDSGVLRKILVGEGDPVVVGADIAVASTDPATDEQAPSDASSLPALRVVGNITSNQEMI